MPMSRGPASRLLRGACCAALAAALAGELPAADFSAGPSAGCTFATLTEALAAAAANGTEPDTICLDFQLVAGPFAVDLDATGDLEIVGCAQCTGSGAASLAFSAGRGLIVTAAGPTRRHLALRNLGLYNYVPYGTAGRKLDVSGHVSVTTDFVGLFAGDETEGGALRVAGPDAELVYTRTSPGYAGINNDESFYSVSGDGGLVLVEGASVRFTRTSFWNGRAGGRGGAIACRGGGTVVLEDSPIEENYSGTGGGGISADDCTLTLSGTTTLARNRCWDDQFVPCAGGGLLASGGSQVSMTGPPRLYWDPHYDGMSLGNRAATGAALLALGAGTFVEAQDIDLINDEASEGSVIAVESGAGFSILRSTLQWADAADSLVRAAGAGSTVVLESVRFWRDTGGSLLGVSGGAHLTAAHVTADGNPGTVPSALVEGQGSTLELYSSLMLDGRVLGPPAAGAEVTADCVIALDLTDFPPPPRPDSYLAVAAAGDVLQWPDRRIDLRLDSPATDRCDASFYLPVGGDLDSEVRPFDQPPAGSSQFGLYDAGADESRGFLFADFEEGDCSEWSLGAGCP